MEVKIGHNIYTIVEDPYQNDEGRCGVTYKQQSRIRINAFLSPAVHRETLLHEVLHAICDATGVTDEERLTEEEWISRVTSGLLTALRDNPVFIETLLA